MGVVCPQQTFLLLGFVILLTGIIGVVFNRKNFLVTMLCIELAYLGSTWLFLISSNSFSEQVGQLYALTLVLLAAAEAALGLGLLIVVYKQENRIDLSYFTALAG